MEIQYHQQPVTGGRLPDNHVSAEQRQTYRTRLDGVSDSRSISCGDTKSLTYPLHRCADDGHARLGHLVCRYSCSVCVCLCILLEPVRGVTNENAKPRHNNNSQTSTITLQQQKTSNQRAPATYIHRTHAFIYMHTHIAPSAAIGDASNLFFDLVLIRLRSRMVPCMFIVRNARCDRNRLSVCASERLSGICVHYIG